MKNILLCVFLFFGTSFQDGIEDKLVGKWTYSRGTYEYYDAANHKLKESEMNAVSDMEIQLNKDYTAVIAFPNNRSRTTTYSVAKADGGRYAITTELRGNAVKYEISTLTSNSLVLLSRMNTSFLLDGDVNKKVSYCLVKIYLERKL